MNTFEQFQKPEIQDLDIQITEQEIRFGSRCPKCRTETLDYDGCLNLVCLNCGFISSGSFT